MPSLTTGARQSYTFRDMKNQTRTTSVYLTTITVNGPTFNGEKIAVDLHNLSGSQYVLDNGGTDHVIKAKGFYTTQNSLWLGAITNPADYVTVADSARFTFYTADGDVHTISVLCPLDTIFLADRRTVDFTNSAVKQFVADVTFATFGGTTPVTDAPLVNAAGSPLVSSIGGTRRSGKVSRKFNQFTRNPALSGQGL